MSLNPKFPTEGFLLNKLAAEFGDFKRPIDRMYFLLLFVDKIDPETGVRKVPIDTHYYIETGSDIVYNSAEDESKTGSLSKAKGMMMVQDVLSRISSYLHPSKHNGSPYTERIDHLPGESIILSAYRRAMKGE